MKNTQLDVMLSTQKIWLKKQNISESIKHTNEFGWGIILENKKFRPILKSDAITKIAEVYIHHGTFNKISTKHICNYFKMCK